MKKIRAVILIIAFLAASLNYAIAAQEKKAADETKPEIKRQVLKKEVVGEVAGIAPNFIAVDYKQDTNSILELAIPMDKDTKFSRRSLKELTIGDLVAVKYEETIETVEGQKPKTLKRLAKVVEFRQPSKIKFDTETGVLESR
ncbi:MAG: hypothetical protein WC532_08640 [Candidatus Omnitrophota bacterium]